jgi:SAM-dependent methyltransferase
MMSARICVVGELRDGRPAAEPRANWRSPVPDPDLLRTRLLGVLSGTWLAQACSVLAALGLPDRMAAGPATAEDLAAWSGADPRALRRLLAALAGAGLLRRAEPGAFQLTPLTQLLRSDVPGSLRDTAIMYGEEVFRSFAELAHTVRTGEPAFARCYGRPFYRYLEDNDRAAATFHAAMGGQPLPAALDRVELGDPRTVVDLGGGSGGLLAAILRDRPGCRGVLLELPAAARHARGRLADAGLLDRVDVVEGSFFDPVPAGGDLYLLCRILHNWDDRHAVALLRGIRRAMPRHGRLIVVEDLLGERSRMVDLLMLATVEGNDRTLDEYRELLGAAGFRALRAYPEGAIEATTAP